METILIKALQFLFSLLILILVHELGHFLFARMFKVRVDKFYLFFNPWFSLFKFKPKNSDTEYGIGWVPLGGYCKISGMIDESLDKDQMSKPPQPYEFRSKSAGARLLIMTAGVIFNFLLALFIYSMVLFKWGDTYLSLQNATYGMTYSDTFKDAGFVDGDILLKADAATLERINDDCLRKILNARTVTVVRNGQTVTINMPDDMPQRIMREKKGAITGYRYPMFVKEVTAATARNAGLLAGDHITGVNGIATVTADEVTTQLSANRNSAVTIDVVRNGQPVALNIPVDTDGHIGIIMKTPIDLFETVTVTYNIVNCIPAGIRLGVKTLKGYASDLKYLFTAEGAKSVGGFGAIANLFPPVWDWRLFWMQTAFLSIMLAFMNILPIPALDGGHALFLLYEVITRHKPSDKFLEYAQITGMIILFALLLFANGNDLFRFLKQ